MTWIAAWPPTLSLLMPAALSRWNSGYAALTENTDGSWTKVFHASCRMAHSPDISVLPSMSLRSSAPSERLQTAYSEIEQLKQRLEQDNLYLQEEIKLEHHGVMGGERRGSVTS